MSDKTTVNLIPLLKESEVHYSHEIKKSLIIKHGWTYDGHALYKRFSLVKYPDNDICIHAIFCPRNRYLSYCFKAKLINDIDGREYEHDYDDGAKLFNDQVSAFVRNEQMEFVDSIHDLIGEL